MAESLVLRLRDEVTALCGGVDLPAVAKAALQSAGDRMLQAVIVHSDNSSLARSSTPPPGSADPQYYRLDTNC